MTTTLAAAPEIAAYRQSADDVLRRLDAQSQRGLTQSEAAARLARDGANELTAECVTPAWKRFLAQFRDVLVILLLVAALISAALWLVERATALPYEALAILAIVLLNAVMGFVQQSRAEQAVLALRRMSAATAIVVRDGRRSSIAAADLVSGDVMLIEEGDLVSADARLIESVLLRMAEAQLTGESVPVEKDTDAIAHEEALGDRANMVFSGTSAIYGRGRAVVTATGMRTELGRIADMLKATPDEATPLQRELDRVGKLLGLIVVAIALAMIVTILVAQGVADVKAVFDVLILGVALAVAGVPEGLPAVVTASLALGVQRLAKRNAIVRHLAAVETLGSATVIASDKTGTLTKNEMTVRRLVTATGTVAIGGSGYGSGGELTAAGGGQLEGALRIEAQDVLAAAQRASNASVREDDGHWTVLGDPTEGALIVAARKAGLTDAKDDRRLTRIAEVPFSSQRKRMSTVHRDAEHPESLLVSVKGAPGVVLALCTHERVGDELHPLSEARRTAILASNTELASASLRTLAVACRSLPRDQAKSDDGSEEGFDDRIEADLVFLGLIGMIDPPRPEAQEAVARAQRAGIRPVMITGDHPSTAAAIASEIGIAGDGRVVTGIELAAMSDTALDLTVKDVSVYARVNPEHKLRIVRALQRGGATVAMTGDGVNDAPALKAADIGVAMGITGTDVSKEAADIVLSDDNFASIVAAVEEGRAIFENIRKFLRYLLSSNLGEVLTMFFGVLLSDVIGLTGHGSGHVVLPLLAIQILWINLVTDGAPALALAVDPADPDTMTRPPRLRGEGVVTGRMWVGIVYVGVIMAAGTLLVLDAALPGGLIEGAGSLDYGQTMAFTTLTLFQLFNLLNARSDVRSAFSGLLENRWLWAAVGLSLLMHGAVLYVPWLQEAFSTVALTMGDWLVCIAVASTALWLREVSKIVARAELLRGHGTATVRQVVPA
ncbi:cation-translocating P-type ATPase [Bosea sp. PAMC 26642]|uniref:cation-translocating P-type ATPase n=1 Tax=Bosea sp. (strain PAMC 26642) TaxID=1792307 RepID=UPI0007702BEF|nr:cation-translocating P-type ATPase [Bosea sp. PAMC 26642]AMJ59695.1 haloacid dehalogenase [Bosea sp. PAMC 26642]